MLFATTRPIRVFRTKESLSVDVSMDLNNCGLWLPEWELYYLPDLGQRLDAHDLELNASHGVA